MAVQKAMREKDADALLHLGDFVYQPDFFPQSCPNRYIKEIKETLSDPYPIKLFVAGDNDLPPKKWKPKASGCWDKIDHLDSGFDTPGPRANEGTRVIGNALIGDYQQLSLARSHFLACSAYQGSQKTRHVGYSRCPRTGGHHCLVSRQAKYDS